MESDSVLLMTKALLLSLIIHLILLVLMGRFSFPETRITDFPSIRVQLVSLTPARSPESGQKEQNIGMSEARGEVEVIEENTKAENDIKSVISEPVPEKTVIPEAQIMKQASVPEPVAEPVPSTFQEEIRLAQDSEPVSSTNTIEKSETGVNSDIGVEGDLLSEQTVGEDSAEGPSGSGVNTASENTSAGNADIPDVRWDGSGLTLRSIPEPGFSIPYNAVLPEYIEVSFSVQHDGTVLSIRILPPKSGHIDLDRQIRAYVARFLFDEFDSAEEIRRGILKLSLKAMGSSGI